MKTRRIIKSVLMVLGLSLIGLLFYYAVWLLSDEHFIEMWQWGWPWTSWMVMVDYIGCCLFTTVVTLYYWRRRERTERERDKFRLQALENQLSPHFVFNNFSILADLIEVNPKQASAYLMDLSKVYRYTLTHLDHSTVKLKEELEFLHRYLSLLEQRFGEGIQVRIDDSVTAAEGSLPPAAMQMLIENAIKHNEHTKAHPLIINVKAEGCRLSVSNKKQPIIKPESTNVGLHNITERYRLLTHQKVEITDSQDEYCVTIPLIK
jgi:LytS/YehU family sensor histidine kinase